MKYTQHLADLLTMPDADFEDYLTAVHQIGEWRKTDRVLSIPAPRPHSTREVPQEPLQKPMVRPTLPQRAPLRPPKPESLRACVHGVLRDKGRPTKRTDIIQAVAERRGHRTTDQFKSKVGDILTNRHDPFIRRIGHGTYTYVPEQ